MVPSGVVMTELRSYLARAFPGLALQRALFYAWPVGLRFELGGALSVEDGRLEHAVDRAVAILEAAGGPDDDVFVVLRDTPQEDYLWSLLDTMAPAGMGVATERGGTEEFPEVWTDVVLPGRRGQIDARSLFSAIANNDFSRYPHIRRPVWIVNASNDTVFSMYDDRGADLIAAQRETIRPVYERFNAWLLHYDLERMRQCFDASEEPDGSS